MKDKVGFLGVYRYRESQVILALTAGLLFLEGLLIRYRLAVEEVYRNTFALSPIQFVVFIFGPFLVATVLLFAVLYVVGSRVEQRPALSALLPGLAVAVVFGSLVGQRFSPVGHPPAYLYELFLHPFLLERMNLYLWRLLVEGLVIDLLTVVAALGLARLNHERAKDENDRADSGTPRAGPSQ
jgi:hypothetical protein